MSQQELRFETLSGPSVGPILEIHQRAGRSHDGWITFHRKAVETPHKLDGLFAVRCDDLRSYFPQFVSLLDADAFFSINGFHRETWSRSKYSPDGLDLPYPNRKKDNLRWLTACFADLDCYRLGIPTGTAVGEILNRQDAGTIPAPSMLVRSGQGVWAFWFLVADKDDHALPPAFPEKVDLWYLIQRRLGDLFAKFGSDADARDACRITRIPGSINRKSGTRTEYWLRFDEHGQRHVYRLGDLAAELGIKAPQRLTTTGPARIKSKQHQEWGKSGWQARWKNNYADFKRLCAMRGGFAVGCRNKAVCALVAILRTLKATDAEVEAEVRSLFESLEQTAADPYTEAEMLVAIRQTAAIKAVVGKTPGKRKFAELFDITPQEAAELISWTIPAARFRDLDAEEQGTLTTEERAARRRATLQTKLDQLHEAGLQVPTLTRLAEWLNEHGHECCLRTVKDDLAAIEYINPRRHRRRRRGKSDDDRPLFQ